MSYQLISIYSVCRTNRYQYILYVVPIDINIFYMPYQAISIYSVCRTNRYQYMVQKHTCTQYLRRTDFKMTIKPNATLVLKWHSNPVFCDILVVHMVYSPRCPVCKLIASRLAWSCVLLTMQFHVFKNCWTKNIKCYKKT